ncbi:Annexin [Morchella conica CCBAS932]|uniref:Annexin n=1 Tax=Morchella conica CCBAS932 TaxID=1392247 RepID=A0A3N4KQ63_9PEZI|nr:Annexin [Morchella conica CCBAS932]
MSDPTSSKPQLPQVNTQVNPQGPPPPQPQQQQQQQPPQQQQQQPQQPPPPQQQQQQQQQPQLQLQQPPQQQQQQQQQQGIPYQQQQPYGSGPPSPSNLAPQVSYQQQPYGSGPPSPINLAAPQTPYQQQQYGSAPPSPSNLAPPPTGSPQPGAGYTADECAPPHYNAQPDADVIAKALTPTSGLGNRDGEEALIHILPFLAPPQLESIRQHILAKNGVRVVDLVDKALSNDFQDVVRAVVLGPLAFDAWLLKRAMGGVGYKAVYMDMVLLGRRNGDIKAIEAAYYRAHGKHLVESIKSELSGPVEALFRNAIEARRQDENAPVVEAAVEKDVVELYTAMVGSVEAHVVAEILVTRSDAQIRRIVEMYNSKYGVGKEKKLEDVIVKKFKGHMEDALLYIVQGANNRALRDARMLERTMKGVGTRTEELTYRLAILHWDKAHLEAVKAAYKAEFPKRTDLVARVKGDTSGNHGKMLVALIA